MHNFYPKQLTNQTGIEYQEYSIPSSYKEDISYSWTLETNTRNSTYKILPDASIDIIFQEVEGSLYSPFISSPFTKLTEVTLPANSKFVGIRFKPGKIRSYLDFELESLEDEFSFLGDRGYPNLESFLSSYTKKKPNPLSRFDNSLTNLMYSSLSQRQKRRIFKQVTGFTIRQFQKIMKFQGSLNNMNSYKFFDQAHMIKTYKDLTGMTPIQLSQFL